MASTFMFSSPSSSSLNSANNRWQEWFGRLFLRRPSTPPTRGKVYVSYASTSQDENDKHKGINLTAEHESNQQERITEPDVEPPPALSPTPSTSTNASSPSACIVDESFHSCSHYCMNSTLWTISRASSAVKKQYQMYHERHHLQHISAIISCTFLLLLGVPFTVLAKLDYEHRHYDRNGFNNAPGGNTVNDAGITQYGYFIITLCVIGTSLLIMITGLISHFYHLQQQSHQLKLIQKTNESKDSDEEDKKEQDPSVVTSVESAQTRNQEKKQAKLKRKQQLKIEDCLHCKRFWRYCQMFAIHVCIILFFIRRSDPYFCSSLIHNYSSITPPDNGMGVVNGPVSVVADDAAISSGNVSSSGNNGAGGVFLHDYFCGSEGSSTISINGGTGLLSLNDALLLLITHPIVQSILFPGVNIFGIWLQALSELGVYLAMLMASSQSPPVSILLIWIMLNASLPLSHHRKNIRMFLMHQQLHDDSEQGAKEQEEQHLSEMRFVIANVAHDLKTVSV